MAMGGISYSHIGKLESQNYYSEVKSSNNMALIEEEPNALEE